MSAKIPGNGSLLPLSSAFTTTSTPTAGSYYAVPPLAEPPMESAPEYEELMETFIVDGVGTKRLGFRGRKITFNIVIIGADKSACETTRNTIMDAATALARYSVQVPDGTQRDGCKLARGSGNVLRWFNLGNMVACLVEMNFMQLSETN